MKRKRIVLILSIFILGSFFITSTLIGINKDNPITAKLNKDTQIKISAIWPQGWGFFSKNPRGTNMKIYALDGSREIRLPNMIVKNGFGLNRKGRAQAIEAGRINSKIPNQKWVSCSSNCNIAHLQNTKSSIDIKNDSPRKLLKGSYIFAQEKAVPWNYRKYYSKDTNITKYIKVNIE
ncbi:hypothetical protein A9958_13295 (plasmid) [Staphylococcus simulans]|uniref:SdpA family antimicrobial peptide system protein n=1 Tax=Staphylococcus simulans TaxID=1286 RepID=UPI000D0A2517|nr:SdpA family antimicrobial peptide system protein [Staphylococcus simulans]AVO03405.1 hypothetical protein BI282_13290 [Staphylococcus simulans]AVO06332.1 hypothetical protein BI283_13090 [Staphylococcus simulans]AWG19953.1 hypothetical protein A9958_13295 [Staphylococcus simulans]AWI02837.1 hypothetical protein A7X73_12830 [Staphylococcus simulans]